MLSTQILKFPWNRFGYKFSPWKTNPFSTLCDSSFSFDPTIFVFFPLFFNISAYNSFVCLHHLRAPEFLLSISPTLYALFLVFSSHFLLLLLVEFGQGLFSPLCFTLVSLLFLFAYFSHFTLAFWDFLVILFSFVCGILLSFGSDSLVFVIFIPRVKMGLNSLFESHVIACYLLMVSWKGESIRLVFLVSAFSPLSVLSFVGFDCM